MTHEEKLLLLKDLSARLPYGVKVHIIDATGAEIDDELTPFTISHIVMWTVKPYLRPLSSITEKEGKELDEHITIYDDVDWMNAHHFDYRGLIEKGLALEAPEGMYKEN